MGNVLKLSQLGLILLFLFPVLLAHQYDTEATTSVLMLSVTSVVLFVYSLTALFASIRCRRRYLLSALPVFMLLALFFYLYLLSYYFQGEAFNTQFLYHLNLTSWLETVAVYPLLNLLFVVWLSGIILAVVFLRARGSLRPAVLMLLLLGSVLANPPLQQLSANVMEQRSYVRPLSLDVVDWERTGLNQSALNEDPDALAGKNLVLIYLEGLEALYTDEEVFPGLTPNINALSATGIRHHNMQQVNGSGWTVGGLVTSMCGTPLVHDFGIGGNSILFTRFLNRASCLSDVLAAAGYEQTFMGGASMRFAGKGNFLQAHSYDRVLGRGDLRPRLADPDYVNGWGLYDDSLFDLAAGEYERLAASGKPFNLTLLTVDTHHPEGMPSKSCPPYAGIDNSILHAVHCSDFLLGQFIGRISASPAYQDTVVVVMSDHLGMRNEAFPLFPEKYPRRLLFFALNTGMQLRLDQAAFPMDVAPTVLGLMDVEHDSHFLAGADLMQGVDRELPSGIHSRLRADTIAFINSNVLSGDPGRVLYELEEGEVSQMEYWNEIAGTKVTSRGLEFTATGPDPYFVLPPLASPQAEELQVFMSVYSPHSTETAVYFAGPEDVDFSEERVIRQGLHPGRNELLFIVQGDPAGQRLRVDPGGAAGSYIIESLVIMSEYQEESD